MISTVSAIFLWSKNNFHALDIIQKTNIIRDYLEDINEIPKSRMFWPRQIWGKYANKLEVCFINALLFVFSVLISLTLAL